MAYTQMYIYESLQVNQSIEHCLCHCCHLRSRNLPSCILHPASCILLPACKLCSKTIHSGQNLLVCQQTLFIRERDKKRPPPPPLLVPWESEILGLYFNVVVDAIGLETDFTLETIRKKSGRKTTEENLKDLNFTIRTLSS